MKRLTDSVFNLFISGQRATFLTLLLVLTCMTAHAQVGIGTETPAESAQLDIVSPNKDKGLLIPRLNESDRIGIAFPAKGLLVYQEDEDTGFYYYNGTAWVKLAVAGSSPSIIPYSSGLPVTLTTTLGGAVSTLALLGAGNNSSGVSLIGNNIDLTGGLGLILNMAFTVPKDGVIRSLSGTFSTTAGVNLLSPIQVKAEVYVAPANSNIFEPRGSVNIGPVYSNIVALGETRTGSGDLNIPIQKGQRVLVAFSAEVVEGLSIVAVMEGYASAGLSIE